MTDSERAGSLLAARASSAHASHLWKAYTRGYTLAGRWHTVRVIGTVGLALVAPVITYKWNGATDPVAVVASIWLLASRIVLGPFENWERRRAVNAQEVFDTNVFQLPWNDSLAGQPPAEEDVFKAASRYRKAAPVDWYADTKDLPRPLDVILCQRSNAVWGRKTHFAYAIVLGALGACVFLAGLLMAVLTEATLSEYLLRVFLPSVPALLDTIDMSRDHFATSRQKGAIERATDSLWSVGICDPAAITTADCRQLQDQTYRLRLSGPRVANTFYKLRRDSDERAMQEAVAQRIAAYHTQHSSSSGEC